MAKFSLGLLLLMLSIWYLPCQCQANLSQQSFSNMFPTPKRLTFQTPPVPRVRLNQQNQPYFTNIQSSSTKNSAYLSQQSFSNMFPTPKRLTLQTPPVPRVRLNSHNQPFFTENFNTQSSHILTKQQNFNSFNSQQQSTSTSNSQVLSNGLPISGYLVKPLAMLDSLESKQGQIYRHMLVYYSTQLYQNLMRIRGIPGGIDFFRKMLSGFVWQIIKAVENIQNLIRRKARENLDPISVTGQNNQVSIKSSPSRNFISIAGEDNTAIGNQLLVGGHYINANGRNMSIFGSNTNVYGRNNFIVGQNRNLMLEDKLVLKNFYIDIPRFKAGLKYIQDVPEGANHLTVPYQ